MEPEDALELCDGILADLPDLPEKAEDFAADVEERITSMSEWIRGKCFCTEAMADTLRNTRRAVDRWMEGGR